MYLGGSVSPLSVNFNYFNFTYYITCAMHWQIKCVKLNGSDPGYHPCVCPQALSEFGSEVGTPIPSCSSLPEEEENPVEASSAKCDDALVSRALSECIVAR